MDIWVIFIFWLPWIKATVIIHVQVFMWLSIFISLGPFSFVTGYMYLPPPRF